MMTTVKKKSLNGNWEFKRVKDKNWMRGTVPGDVYNDLLESGEIEDPYYGDNELDLQWIGESNWEYRRPFDISKEMLDLEKQILVCRGLDTFAEISVNGEKVGTTENMHRRYEFDLKDKLQKGKNEIRIKFNSPVKQGAKRKKQYHMEIPESRYKVDQPGRNFIRKAQCHYGWDWGPCFPTVGIWKDIELLSYSSPRIRYAVTSQDHEDGRVKLKVRVGLDAPEPGEYELAASIAGEKTTKKVSLQEGENESEIKIEIEDPDLWWPTGYGEQNLYDMEVSISDGKKENQITKKIGFREIELVREPDEEGESFFFKVNGVPIYAKGANWIPADSFYGRMNPERYEELLGSALKANMNTIRVWGGGIYELDEFYQYCDENGILVWQDFMFACSTYPANEEFLQNVEEEVRHQVRRLSDHPSIALWCGNVEVEEALSHWYTDWENQDKLREEYDKLFYDTVGRVVKEEDPSRPFWPSSPSSSGERDPIDPSTGDVHYWEVWHGEKPFSDYQTVEPRFSSEFGYQSFPSTQTLSTVMTEDSFNPTAPLMEHHQRSGEGNTMITRRMADNFRYPFSFEDFIYLSQIQQGLAMKTAIEHWRRLKPHCMGTLYWQLNDIWPVVSWSSLEYGGRWKASHYMVKRFYAPVLVSSLENGDKLDVWLTSDLNAEVTGKVVIEAFRFDGEKFIERSLNVKLSPLESKKVVSLSEDDILSGNPREEVMLRIRYEGPGESYSNFHFFEPFKSLNLPETELEVNLEENGIKINARKAALFVDLDSGSIPGTFSDNYFHMVPGETQTIEFDPRNEAEEDALKDELTVKHLRETY